MATFRTDGICVPAMLNAQQVTNALKISLGTRSTRPPRPLNPKTQVETPDQNINEEAAASLSASVVSEAISGARVVETSATGPMTTKDDAAKQA